MRIKPASGLKIRDHVSRQLLPEEGIDIEATDGIPSHPYWQRLLRDRDVIVEEPPRKTTAPSVASADEPRQEEAALAADPNPQPDAESGS